VSIKEFWDFADEAGVPAAFTSIVGGSGAVSISTDYLRCDTGGTSSGDNACVVYGTALDQSKLYVIYADVKISGLAGAWTPNIVGLIDSSGEPGAMTGSARNAALRLWQESQLSGTPSGSRVQLKMKNPSATQYQYVRSSGLWTSTFTHTDDYFLEDAFYRFVILYDGTQATPRVRSLIYGDLASGTEGAYNLRYDSTWRDFDTSAFDVDPFDNDMWVMFADNINDASPNERTIMDFRRIMIGELDETVLEEIAFSNYSITNSDTFPYDYDIHQFLNPMPDAQSCWVPRDINGSANVVISRGSDHWVKDPNVFYDGTTYWMVVSIRDSGDTDSDIWVYSLTDLLDGTWGSATEISNPGASEDKHEFPWLTKYDGTWYLFYGVELDSGAWEIQYKTTTATNPTSGWSAATTILTAGAATDFDDGGVTQPFLIWHSGTFTGGTWYMMYAGYDGVGDWEGGLAKSTTGITGTYTRTQTTPLFAKSTVSTLANGAGTTTSAMTVDSTTGFAQGMAIWVDDPRQPLEVISVDDSTSLTIQAKTSWANNDPVKEFGVESFAPRFARQINGTWVVYGTAFKDTGGYETSWAYIDTTDAAAIENGTFRALRARDTSFKGVVPMLGMNERSRDEKTNENIGGVWAELSAVVSGATILPLLNAYEG